MFARSGAVWNEQAYLRPAVGAALANDHFGAAIAVSEDTVVVGACLEDSSSTGINSTPNERERRRRCGLRVRPHGHFGLC